MPYIDESTNRLIFNDADQGGIAGNIARAAQAFANAATAIPQIRMQQSQQDRENSLADQRMRMTLEDRQIAAQDRSARAASEAQQAQTSAQRQAATDAMARERADFDAAKEFDRRYPAAATWLDQPLKMGKPGTSATTAVDPADRASIESAKSLLGSLRSRTRPTPVSDAGGRPMIDTMGRPVTQDTPLSADEVRSELLRQYDPQNPSLHPEIRKFLTSQGYTDYSPADTSAESPFGADTLLMQPDEASSGGFDGFSARNLDMALQDPLAARRFTEPQLERLRGRISERVDERIDPSAMEAALLPEPQMQAADVAAPVAAPVAAMPASPVQPTIAAPSAEPPPEHVQTSVQRLTDGIVAAEARMATNPDDEAARATHARLVRALDAAPGSVRQQVFADVRARAPRAAAPVLAPPGSSPLNRQAATMSPAARSRPFGEGVLSRAVTGNLDSRLAEEEAALGQLLMAR